MVKTKMKFAKIQVTFDKQTASVIWDAIERSLKTTDCPFCGEPVTPDTLAAAAIIDDEPRVVDDNVICILQFSQAQDMESE